MKIVRSLFVGPDLSPTFNTVVAVSLPYLGHNGQYSCNAAIHRKDSEFINLFKWQWTNGKHFTSSSISKIPVIVDDGVSIKSMCFTFLKPQQPHLVVGYSSGEVSIHTPRGSMCFRSSFHPDSLLHTSCIGELSELTSCQLVIVYSGNIVVHLSLKALHDHIYEAHSSIEFSKIELTGRRGTIDAAVIASRNHNEYVELSLAISAEVTEMSLDASVINDPICKKKFEESLKNLFHPSRLGCFGVIGIGKGPCASLHWKRASTSENMRKIMHSLRHQLKCSVERSKRSERKDYEGEEDFHSVTEGVEVDPLIDHNQDGDSSPSQGDETALSNTSNSSPNQPHSGGLFLSAASKAWVFATKAAGTLLGADGAMSPQQYYGGGASVANHAALNAPESKQIPSNTSFSLDSLRTHPMFQPATILRWNSKIVDTARVLQSLTVSPWDHCLACTSDGFGRVMLMDLSNLAILHMWKGYRDAQVQFTEIRSSANKMRTTRAVAIYLSKRGFLELWSLERFERIGAAVVGEGGILVGCMGSGEILNEVQGNCSDDVVNYPTPSAMFIRSTGEVLLIGTWLDDETQSIGLEPLTAQSEVEKESVQLEGMEKKEE